jgi:hypothetical protein
MTTCLCNGLSQKIVEFSATGCDDLQLNPTVAEVHEQMWYWGGEHILSYKLMYEHKFLL